MRFKFKSCPDCGDNYNPIMLCREVTRDVNGDMVSSTVRAVCSTCGLETKGHRNVRECVDEWNNIVIYK